ncbi:MAG: lipocalin-like domain-containing protein [Caulobacterales bacterium]|nr:lipocalin-like domain-containing protein [Caulobacterales bacterium]
MNDYAKQFVGVWAVQAWTVTNLDTQEVTPVFEGRSAGHILYTADGWVCASLMEKDRPLISDDRTARYALHHKLRERGAGDLSTEEYAHVTPLALSALGYVGYFGPYDADDAQVHHHVRSAGRPNHVGVTLSRHYEFSGDQLVLWGDAFGYRDRVTWRRVAGDAAER